MKRPLVWYGLAVVFGEILGFMDSWICLIGCLCVHLMIFLAGKAAKNRGLKWRCFLALPVFVFIGVGAAFRAELTEYQQICAKDAWPEEVTGKVIEAEKNKNGWVWQLLWHNMKLVIYQENLDLDVCPGDVLTVCGAVEMFEHARNPGTYDAYEYWRKKNIYYCMYQPEILNIKKEAGLFIRRIYGYRNRLQTIYDRILDEEDAGIMSALTLGDTSGIPQDLKSLYQSQGIAHILAISGLHMSIVGMGIYALLRRLYLPMIPDIVISCTIVIVYGIMCGMKTSAVRAMILFIVMMGARWIGRTYDMSSALMLAAVMLLLKMPRLLTDFGFIMSFGCTCFLMLQGYCNQTIRHRQSKETGHKKQNRLTGYIHKIGIRQKIRSAIFLYLLNMPVLAWFQYEIPLYSLFLNLLIVPVMSILLPVGLIGVCAGSVWTPAAQMILPVCHWILVLIRGLAGLSDRLPLSALVTGRPALWIVWLAEICLIIVMLDFSRKNHRFRYLKLLSYLLLFIKIPSSDLQMFMIDVGQGDCCILRTPGGDVTMIDGGSSSKQEIEKYIISKVLKYYGISYINRVVLTHMDQDHINGVAALLEKGYPVGHLYLSESDRKKEAAENIIAAAERQHVPIHYLKKGDTFCWDTLEVRCLLPDDTVLMQSENFSENDCSVVLDMYYGSNHMLFTGDISVDREAAVMDALKNTSALDVLKVAHHGSKYSSSETFLETVRPIRSFISCGENNLYGHPHAETLQRLQNAGSKIYCTAQNGALMAALDGKLCKVRTFLH